MVLPSVAVEYGTVLPLLYDIKHGFFCFLQADSRDAGEAGGVVQPEQTGAHRVEGEPAWPGVLPQAGFQPGLHQPPAALLLHHPLQIQSTPVMTLQNKQCVDPSGSAFIWLSWIRIQEHGNWPKPGILPFKKAFMPS